MNKPLLYEATMVWAQGFPRHSTFGDGAKQGEVKSRMSLIDNLVRAGENSGPGFCSVYSFPRGHSKENNVPEIDTVFLDLDIPSGQGSYDPKDGGNTEDWRRDVSKLLVRARMVAQSILDAGREDYFRVALSGHKGIHLYIDFPALDNDLGSLGQYKNGLQNYAMELIDFFSDSVGVDLHKWVDVTSHDLGRLSRVPNTPHTGAEHVDYTPYCVAISVETLAGLNADQYLELTKEPRELPEPTRTQSESAHEVLTQNVLNASSSSVSSTTRTNRDKSKIETYKSEANDKITVEAVNTFLIQGKPCIEKWVNRDDAYDHGEASRTMEINVIKELTKHNVPVDIIVEFFSDIPGFDRDYTESLVNDIIARYWPSAFVCRNITNSAPQFCLGDSCSIYRRGEELSIN
jgi:hypothetical protein